MLISYFICVLLCIGVLTKPVEENGIQNPNRVARSPTFKKKGPIGLLLGGLAGGNGGSYGGQGGVNNYININNYPQTVHSPHQTVDYGHGNGHGGSYAGSAAVAGHGGSQSQSQSASFSFGPYGGGSFSQSQAQSRGGGYSNFYDY